MTEWTDVGLVLAGSTGPLLITMLNHRMERRNATEDRAREDRSDTRRLYAEFMAAATQVNADWNEYAVFPPSDFDEERKLDARRDLHYQDLNMVTARIRLTAPPPVLEGAEGVLDAVKDTAKVARAAQRGSQDDAAWALLDRQFSEARRAFLDAARRAMA